MPSLYLLILLSLNRALETNICDATTITTVRIIVRGMVRARVRCLMRFGEDFFCDSWVIVNAILIICERVGVDCRNFQCKAVVLDTLSAAVFSRSICFGFLPVIPKLTIKEYSVGTSSDSFSQQRSTQQFIGRGQIIQIKSSMICKMSLSSLFLNLEVSAKKESSTGVQDAPVALFFWKKKDTAFFRKEFLSALFRQMRDS